MYIFSTAIELHIYDSRHITKPKENEKTIKCPPIKSFYFYFFKVMVFSQKKSLLCDYCSRCAKKHIF